MDGYNITEKETETKQANKGIPGSTLKLIAIITMLIDHTAATILERMLSHGYLSGGWYYLYYAMRLIGRLGFPLFCFLLVEGFTYTRNKWKYAGRLAVFALFSEIPFDLAFQGKTFYFSYQNVFFTLLIGLLVMIGFHTVADNRDRKWMPVLAVFGALITGYELTTLLHGFVQGFNSGLGDLGSLSINRTGYILAVIFLTIITVIVYLILCRKKTVQTASGWFAALAVLFAGMALADFLKTDYSGFGVLTIAIMYGFRKNRFKTMLSGCIALTVMSVSEITAFFALIPIRFYNGQRGLNLKYVFYAFYPVHLFVLYLICYFVKIV